MLRTSCTLLLTLAVATLAACSGEGTPEKGGDTHAIDTAQFAPPGAATPGDTAAVHDTAASEPVVTHTAVISTTAGDIQVDLYGLDAPKTVTNFVELAKRGFYDSLAFHRIAPGFVIQAGDPLTKDESQRSRWGEGGESIYGSRFEDELDPNSPSGRRGYVTGTLAMANAGPNTNGSQFFIVISTQGASHLTYNYTIFGMVRSGMEAVHGIEASGAGGENPRNPERIRKITVTELPAAAQMKGRAG